MRPIISLSACVLILGTTTAFANQDPVRTPDPAQTQSSTPQPSATVTTTSVTTPPAASSATPASATTSPTPVAPVSKDAADRADVEKHLLAAGYRLHVGKDGQRTFCRRETPLGSHFETKVCGTAEQLAESTQNSKYLTDKILRMDNNPPGLGTNVSKGY